MTTYLTPLMGASFRPTEIKDAIRGLEVGDELRLERDHENEYDENAIQLVTDDGVFLGFVRKELAAELAPILDDDGTEFYARVIGQAGTLKPDLEINEV